MADYRSGVTAALGATLSVLAFAFVPSVSPAHAAPPPEVCAPPGGGQDDACTARLQSVTANTVDGTFTGTPVGGGSPLTFWGQADAYLKSQGFGDGAPDAVQRWDASIDGVNNVDPSNPDWYGNAKSRAFLPRSLNDLASQFPPGVLLVRFVPDDTHSGWFRLESIQPVAQ